MSADWQSILQAYSDLLTEYTVLEADIEPIKTNNAKYVLYRTNLPDIQKSLKSFAFAIPSDTATFAVSLTGLVAIRFIAADLEQDESATDDINTLRQLVNELQSEIEQSDVFSKKMKEWLLDLVRIIRDSIDRYAIRGSRGMRQQFSLLLGELMQSYDFAEETHAKKPSIWSKITNAIDIMNKIVYLEEKCRPALNFGQKLLPCVKSLGLPAPDPGGD